MLIIDCVILSLLVVIIIHFKRIIRQTNNIKSSYKDLLEINNNLESLKNKLADEMHETILSTKNLKTDLEGIITHSSSILSDMNFINKSAIETMDKLENMIIDINSKNTKITNLPVSPYKITKLKTFKDVLEDLSVK